MRSLILIFGTGIAALVFGAAAATASPAQVRFKAGGCQQVSGTKTVCFESWGVVVRQASGGHIDMFQRRFTEYTSGVLTFEQSDHGHHVIILDEASGGEQVNAFFFSGWSTPTGLMCRFREHLVVVNDTVVHSVDETVCA